MSTPISEALFARWTGAENLSGNPLAAGALQAQADFAALVTTDPNSGAALTMADPISGATRPRVAADCVRFGSKGISVVYPEVTFRPSGGIPNPILWDGSMAVDKSYYDIEIWDNSESGTILTDIQDALERMTDRRRGAPRLSMPSGICFWVQTLVVGTAWYDRNIKSWFLVWRLHFIEGK